MKPEPRLVDLCPAYAKALDEFEELALTGRPEEAAQAWKRVTATAREFRRVKIVERI